MNSTSRMYIGNSLWHLAVNSLSFLAPTSPLARFVLQEDVFVVVTLHRPRPHLQHHRFSRRVPEKSTGPRLSLSPSCCKRVVRHTSSWDSLTRNAAERYHGRQRSNTGIVCVGDRDDPL